MYLPRRVYEYVVQLVAALLKNVHHLYYSIGYWSIGYWSIEGGGLIHNMV
jgi:hypothetical protein